MEHMNTIELTPSELDQPISIKTDGSLATVRDLIAEKAPSEVRAMFGAVATEATSHLHVTSVAELDISSLRRVAVEVLQKSNPDHHVVAIGLGEYTPQQLIREVECDTLMGARVIDAVRMNGLFIEQAITTGKIRPSNIAYTELRLPDFDF